MAAKITEKLLIQRLLLIINEGQREATYKLALLAALIDWCTTNTSNQVPTRQLAERVLALYWNQVRPYHPPKGRSVLVLQQGNKPLILRTVEELHGAAGLRASLTQAKKQTPAEYQRAVTRIERVLADQPIPRLQLVNKQSVPFLYQVNWMPKKGAAEVAKGNAHITLLPGARQGLAELGSLLRPIIERAWVSDLIERNKLESEEPYVYEHLFGSERRNFSPKVRQEFSRIQGGRCFYCQMRLTNMSHVDHFIPWSICPNDAIQNLVLACQKCNSSKTDLLALPNLVTRWLGHLSTNRIALEALADEGNLDSDKERSILLARGKYQELADGALLWGLNCQIVRYNTKLRRQIVLLLNSGTHTLDS